MSKDVGVRACVRVCVCVCVNEIRGTVSLLMREFDDEICEGDVEAVSIMIGSTESCPP